MTSARTNGLITAAVVVLAALCFGVGILLFGRDADGLTPPNVPTGTASAQDTTPSESEGLSPTPVPSPTNEASAAEEARTALGELYRVQAEVLTRGGGVDVDDYDGIGTDRFVSGMKLEARRYAEQGLQQVSAASLVETKLATTSADFTKVTLTYCADNRNVSVSRNGATPTPLEKGQAFFKGAADVVYERSSWRVAEVTIDDVSQAC